MKDIRVCLAGIGSVATNFMEGIAFYNKNIKSNEGLIFKNIFGHKPENIRVVCGLDIASNKVGKSLSQAMYAQQNIFIKNEHISVDDVKKIAQGTVYPGILLDRHSYVNLLNSINIETTYSTKEEIRNILEENNVDVFVNLLPTGMTKTSMEYANICLTSGISYINATPSNVARNNSLFYKFLKENVPIFGDDLKSQVGTTLIHRSLLRSLFLRGAKIKSTTQINMGGNNDFLNLEDNSATKIHSKKYALSQFIQSNSAYVRNIYNPLSGPIKTAYIEVSFQVFGMSPARILLRLESDDKANASGCLVDLIRFAEGLRERKKISEEDLIKISAFYMKSPVIQYTEEETYSYLCQLLDCKEVMTL